MIQKSLVIATETGWYLHKLIKDLKRNYKTQLVLKQFSGVGTGKPGEDLRKYFFRCKFDYILLFIKDTQSVKTLIRNIRYYSHKSKVIIFAPDIFPSKEIKKNHNNTFAASQLNKFRENALTSYAQADLIITKTQADKKELTIAMPDCPVPVLSYENIGAHSKDWLESALFARRKVPKLTSIIIICSNQIQYTKLCIASVLKHSTACYELIVIDNGSRDGTASYLKTIMNARIITNDKNTGFMRAANQGMKASKGDYLVLLNNDTIVSPGWLEDMINCASSSKNIGIVGPRTNNVPGAQYVNEAGYKNLKDFPPWAYLFKKRNSGNWFEVFWLIGFCMLIKKEVIEKIGYFSPEFDPAVFEDLDYCLKARQAGYKLYCAGDVFIHHFGQKSYNIKKLLEISERSKKVFIKKWGEDGYVFLMQSCACANLVPPGEI
jgi:GT2 family glycosyltransferase